jgi:hypothetical protein
VRDSVCGRGSFAPQLRWIFGDLALVAAQLAMAAFMLPLTSVLRSGYTNTNGVDSAGGCTGAWLCFLRWRMAPSMFVWFVGLLDSMTLDVCERKQAK